MNINEVIQKVLNVAIGEVGYIEKSSNANLDDKTANAGNANFTKYGRDMHELLPSVMDFPAAWCDAFVDWCFYKAYGVDNAKKLLCGSFDDYTVASAQKYKNSKRWFTSPQVGDQIFFKNSQRINHTGIVYKVYLNTIYTIEGNTSAGSNQVVANGGCVDQKSYTINHPKIAGYGRPNYSLLVSHDSTTLPSQGKAIREIIDVSKYNSVDFVKASQKYRDVIIRVGYRSYSKGELTLDTKFVDHARNAMLSGMKIGAYFYDQSINELEAIQQADFVAGLIKALPISYPVYIDSEYSNSAHNGRADNISTEQRTKNVIAFCERIKQYGYRAGVYASDSWFKTMLNYEQIKHYSIWCARYSANAPTIPKYDIWQYGSAHIPGSSSPIDVNKVYVDYPAGQDSAETGHPLPPENASSPCYCSVKATALNVRNKPSTITGKVLYSLPDGQALNVCSLKNGWCKISVSDEKWCSYKYIRPTVGSVTNCAKLNCRKNPSSNPSSRVLFVLRASDKVNILSDSGNWFYIEKDGRTGYVSKKYITIITS
ncbi:MAG: GH25 family lysozyme [Eisenbergiella sp.]